MRQPILDLNCAVVVFLLVHAIIGVLVVLNLNCILVIQQTETVLRQFLAQRRHRNDADLGLRTVHMPHLLFSDFLFPVRTLRNVLATFVGRERIGCDFVSDELAPHVLVHHVAIVVVQGCA